MSQEFKSGLLWVLAACSVGFLPCSLVLLLDVYPGTTFMDHLSAAVQLLATGIILVVRPVPAAALHTRMPEEHQSQLRYALRSGVLPLASLFSDWRDELAERGSAYSQALRIVPSGTASAILIDVYGIFRDPPGRPFFLGCAVAAGTLGAAAFTFLALRLRNLYVVEARLHEQIHLLTGR